MAKSKSNPFKNPFPKGPRQNSKLSSQQVSDWFKGEGHTLTSEYVNNKSRLNITCSNGHSWETNWRAIVSNNFCPQCRLVSLGGINDRLNRIGFTLTSPFINTTHKIKASCNYCGYVRSGMIHDMEKKPQCLKCYPKNVVINRGEEYRQFLLGIGIELLSYKGAFKALKLKCIKEGCLFQHSSEHIKNLTGCSVCTRKERIRVELEKINYKLLEINGDRVVVKCQKGHAREISFIHRSIALSCPTCNASFAKSSGENELFNWIKSLGVETQQTNTNLIKPFHIDIYIPEKKLGIEYNGLYWHQEDIKGKDAHYNKYLKADTAGILLLQFWEDECLTKPDIIKSMIRSKLGLVKQIQARKCKLVTDLKRKVVMEFLDEHHLQGSCNFNKGLGLEHDGELVMVVTISKHHRKSNTSVLSRVCTAHNIQVIGGLSKLLVRVEKPIVTWSDNRYTNGSVYKKLGFSLEQDLPPDYQYVKKTHSVLKRYSKQSLRKTPEERLTGLTELQLRTAQKYYRIWDAGKKRWALK